VVAHFLEVDGVDGAINLLLAPQAPRGLLPEQKVNKSTRGPSEGFYRRRKQIVIETDTALSTPYTPTQFLGHCLWMQRE
jgi:hypothetical protein